MVLMLNYQRKRELNKTYERKKNYTRKAKFLIKVIKTPKTSSEY